MPTPATPITALPTPPSRDDSVNFAARADAFVAALPTFGTQANSLATNVYNNAVEADADAVAAAASEAAAAASATAAAASANVSAWVSGSTYAAGTAVYSPIDFHTYRRLSASPGSSSTDPSADTVRWKKISVDTPVAVPDGGTGRTSSTAYAVICGGTTSTAAQQSISSVGISGQVLTSNGAGSLPTFQTISGGAQDYIVQSYGIV